MKTKYAILSLVVLLSSNLAGCGKSQAEVTEEKYRALGEQMIKDAKEGKLKGTPLKPIDWKKWDKEQKEKNSKQNQGN